MKALPLLFAMLIAGMIAGCASRRHLSENYGEAYKKAFSTQVVRKQAPPAGALPAGLDPDDARIVNENYRVTMTRKGAEKAKPPGIIVVEDEEGNRAARRSRK